jgi:hypothetical protein
MDSFSPWRALTSASCFALRFYRKVTTKEMRDTANATVLITIPMTSLISIVVLFRLTISSAGVPQSYFPAIIPVRQYLERIVSGPQ